MKIVNDPSIIDAKPIQIVTGCHPHRKVLRHLPSDSITPYVIHIENMKVEGDCFVHMDFHSGHYFQTLENAKYTFDHFG
jgi:hypothetical protein